MASHTASTRSNERIVNDSSLRRAGLEDRHSDALVSRASHAAIDTFSRDSLEGPAAAFEIIE